MPNTGYSIADRTVPARLAAAGAVLFGLVALSGWALHIHALTSVIPGAVEMKANTALSVVLAGCALFLSARPQSAGSTLATRGLAGLVFLVSASTMAEYVFDWSLGLDECRESPSMSPKSRCVSRISSQPCLPHWGSRKTTPSTSKSPIDAGAEHRRECAEAAAIA